VTPIRRSTSQCIVGTPIREIVHVKKIINKKGIAKQSLFEVTRKFSGPA
jgi:hypothetical protein